ncbi:MAG: hypothetical protein ACE5HE_04090 [Phycisphaerae bacterium]
MSTTRTIAVLALAGVVEFAAGCAASRVDFASIERPARSAMLDAYDVFVGSWSWDAEMVYPDTQDTAWSGTADWSWTLDKRCLKGHMSAKSAHAEFESEGVWSRHPKTGKYIWWMFNNWGCPQQGTAKYCKKCKSWCMSYKSVGLDGTTSHGRYTITVVDNDTLDWTMTEWADALHMIKKIELKGTYKRK